VTLLSLGNPSVTFFISVVINSQVTEGIETVMLSFWWYVEEIDSKEMLFKRIGALVSLVESIKGTLLQEKDIV
jgi:hypothetical protein